MGLIDTILALRKQSPLGQVASMGADNAAIPIPGMDEGDGMQGGSGVPAMLQQAINNPPVSAPQLAPQRGLFAGDTPAPGQPYTPPSVPDKLLRVASLASSIAPFVGEGKRQQEAGEFQAEQAQRGRQLDMQQQQQQFQHGLQSQQESRAEQSFPLEQQEAQQKIANTRSPEQTAEINGNTVQATPLGQFFKVNTYKGTASPVTMEGSNNGTPLLTTPKSQRYTVQTDPKNSYPTAVVDNFTKQVAYPGTPEFNADPAIKQAYDAAMSGYTTMRGDKRNDEDYVAGRSDARLGATINAAAARQQSGFQQQMDMMNAKRGLEANDLTPHAQDSLAQNTGRLNSIEQTMQALEPIKNQNDMGHFLTNKLSYTFGREPQYDNIGKNVSDLMGQLNLQQLQGGAAVLKGASRSFQALGEAMKHMPNPVKDSPQLMYNKLGNVRDMLNVSNYAQVAYGMKHQGPPNPHAPAVNYSDVAKVAQAQGISVADAARQAVAEGYQLLDSGYPGSPGKQLGKQ